MVVVAIPFFAFAAAFVLAGLSQTHNATSGQTAGGFTGFLQSIVNNSLVAQLLGLTEHAARYVISRFAKARLKELTLYLHSMARLWKTELRAMRAEAHATVDVAHAIERAIPIEAKKAAAPALHLGRANARRLERFRSQVQPAIKRLSVAVDVTIPQQLGRIRAREKQLARDQAKLRDRTGQIENGAIRVWEWLRDHPASAATAAFASVTAIALSRLGLDWTRCDNTGKAGRRLCGLESGLLDALLIGTLAIEGPVSLVGMANELVELADPLVDGITGFVSELAAVPRRTAAEQGFG